MATVMLVGHHHRADVRALEHVSPAQQVAGPVPYGRERDHADGHGHDHLQVVQPEPADGCPPGDGVLLGCLVMPGVLVGAVDLPCAGPTDVVVAAVGDGHVGVLHRVHLLVGMSGVDAAVAGGVPHRQEHRVCRLGPCETHPGTARSGDNRPRRRRR
jgi:hypothetical protein